MTNIPILSFFTGAGFLDMGFMEAGFKVVWRNECDPWFITGFTHGMRSVTGSDSDSKIHNKNSIIDVGPKEILKEAFGNSGPPKTLGFIGGPPCLDFSVGGQTRGNQGTRAQLA